MLFLPVSGASVIGGRELLFRRYAAAWARKDPLGEAQSLDVDGSVQRVWLRTTGGCHFPRNMNRFSDASAPFCRWSEREWEDEPQLSVLVSTKSDKRRQENFYTER